MITSEKIDEWLKEIDERPESAPLILKFIANRLRELTARNEELQAENIALVTDKRVVEYERRIAHLEYQLELLTRQLSMGGTSADLAGGSAEQPFPMAETLSLLVFDGSGRICRFELQPEYYTSGKVVSTFENLAPGRADALRLTSVKSSEELMLVFSSGRIATIPVAEIQAVLHSEQPVDWGSVRLPSPLQPGESLACLVPIGRLALADHFIQVSRRGFVKKIRANMAESIFANHYIGTSIKLAADKTFATLLCQNDQRIALVSEQGYLVCLEIKSLPFAVEEVLKLDATDHLVSAFLPDDGHMILVLTQNGKIIQRAVSSLEVTSSFRSKGQALYSAARREQGVRVVSAVSASEVDWCAALDSEGKLTLQRVQDLLDTGTISASNEMVALSTFSPPDISS